MGRILPSRMVDCAGSHRQLAGDDVLVDLHKSPFSALLVVPMTFSANATQPQLTVSRHELTSEERRRGAEKAAEAKRE
jgi:hypothetical protein